MILLMLACSGTPDSAEPAHDSDTGSDSADSAPPARPLLQNPAIAEDLDPDPRVLEVNLGAAPRDYLVGDTQVSGYAYAGQNPGPLLRVQLGDTLVAHVDNGLADPTTVHWHGASVPFEMDGVPWIIDPIAPGDSKTYSFTLDQPMSGWYHPHFDTERQVDLGLYGPLIVTDPAWPKADHELVLLFDTWGEAPEEGHHSGFVFAGDWTVNGQRQPVLPVSGGETVVAHLINVSNMGYLALSVPGMRVVGGDQGLLSSPTQPDVLVLGPGDRAMVELNPADQDIPWLTLPYSIAGAQDLGEPVELLALQIETPGAAHPGLDWPFQAQAPTPDPGVTAVRYVFQGDEQTGVWLINGETFPDITIHTLPRDQPAVIEVRNLSPSEHPFHLHGMAFEVLSIDGVAPAERRMEDTLNVGIRQTVRLLVPADNVGDWMAHCHILPHAEGGMMTVLRVE